MSPLMLKCSDPRGKFAESLEVLNPFCRHVPVKPGCLARNHIRVDQGEALLGSTLDHGAWCPQSSALEPGNEGLL